MKVISLILLPLILAQDCDYVEWEEEVYYASQDRTKIIQKPIGVCHRDNDPAISEPGGNNSIVFECIAGVEVELMYYENLYCSGEPAYTVSLDTLMSNKGVSDYFYQCNTGIGCEYLIERSYDLGGDCYGDIEDATTWNDTIHIIDGCDGYPGFELYSFYPCSYDDPNNVVYGNWYDTNGTCSDGPAPGESSYGYGSCVNNNPRYPVCGTANIDNDGLTTTTPIDYDQCEVDGEIYESGDIIEIVPTSCNDLGLDGYNGTRYVCDAGDVIEEGYSGYCSDISDEYTACCQSGAPESIGGATCVQSTDECVEFNGTITTTTVGDISTLDCDYVEWQESVYYASQDLLFIYQKPIGVCHSDPSLIQEVKGIEGGYTGSIIFTCVGDIDPFIEMSYYDNNYCTGEPETTVLFEDFLDDLDANIYEYSVVCGTDNGCDYLIERQYNTGDGCYGNISQSVSWNDTIHLIGGCDGYLGFELYSFLPCDDDPNNVNYLNYGDDRDCSSNDPGSTSYGYGSCVNDNPRYPVCGVGQVQSQEPTTTNMEEAMTTTEEVIVLEPYCDFVQFTTTAFYAQQDRPYIIQKPMDVCHTDATLFEPGTGVIFSCNPDLSGVSVNVYDNQLCEGDATIQTLAELMTEIGVSSDDYVYQCGTGIGCNYIIERQYDTGDGCYGNISQSVSWNDTIHLIGGCDGYLGFELYSFLPCDDDPNNVNYNNYGSDSDCTATDPGSTSYGYGSCVGPYPRYPVCGEAEVPDWTCTVGDIVYENLDVIGTDGNTCNDDGNTYIGSLSRCVGGEVVDEDYDGDCDAESTGSFCCQSGLEGSTGGATCVVTDCEIVDDSMGNRIMTANAVFYAFMILSSFSVVIV